MKFLKFKIHILQVKGSQSNRKFIHNNQSKALPHFHAVVMQVKIIGGMLFCKKHSWVVTPMNMAFITKDVIAITLDLHQ
jgi:hypothetical protein